MSFEPADPALEHRLSAVGVVKPWTTVTGLYSHRQVADHHVFVMIQVRVERFNGGRFATPLVFGQRHEHPAHAGCLLPGSIEYVLPRMNNLLGTWQRPIHFAIPHARLVGTRQEVVVRHIQENALATAPAIERRDGAPLVPT